MEKLANAEQLGKNKIPTSTDEEKKQASFATHFITKIVDNIQLSVRNVHIRYEDDISNPKHPFALGITLSEFSVVSTDGEWNRAFIVDHRVIHKLCQMESLSIYWDTDVKMPTDASDPSKMEAYLEKSIFHQGKNDAVHNYILTPISGHSRITLNKKPKPADVHTLVEIMFEELGLVLDNAQFRDAFSVLGTFSRLLRRQKVHCDTTSMFSPLPVHAITAAFDHPSPRQCASLASLYE